MVKLLKNFGKREWVFIAICFFLVCTQVFFDLKMPDYMSKITVLVETEGSKMKDILTNGSYMLLCAFGSLACAVIGGYLIANITARFSFNTRKKLFNKVEKMGMQEVKKFSTSSLITRTTNDITQVEMIISMGVHDLLKAPITAIFAIKKILNKNLEWTFLTGSAVLILLITIVIITSIVIPRFKIVQKLTDKLNGVTRENLTGVKIVRAFNAEEYQEEKFDKVNSDLTNLQLSNQKTFAFLSPVMNMVLHLLTVAIYFVGVILINKALLIDKLTIFSNMVVFTSYAIEVIMSFLILAFIFMLIPRAEVSAKRINEVLDTDLTILDGVFDKETEESGKVEFKHVYFKYPDAEEWVLEDISFVANKGETVAFIGSTGSGKSTLINLVPRFYDATKGEVLIDDVNVKDYKLDSLYNKLGYVPQKAVMFNGTVKSNINFGKKKGSKITKEDIDKAVEVSQAKEFVSKLDDGINSHIAQGGTNISGGQKQRLAIARAVARKPEIYIFDDSFSALDYKTDSVLRKELKKYTKDSTSLIVAQRIGTILKADKIIVLDEGKCVGMGTHKELLKTCEVYKQIALSQLSKEELENA